MPQSLKVLHVFSSRESFIFLRGQIDYMRSRGVDTLLVASPPADPLLNMSSIDVPVYDILMPRRISPFSDLVAVGKLVCLLRQLRPDIVHAHTPKGGLVGMLAATISRIPVRIYHLRGLRLETAAGIQRFIFTLAEWLTCRLAQRVVCVSPSLRDAAVSAGVLSVRSATVLENGSGNGVDAVGLFAPASIDAEERESVRASVAITSDQIAVLFLGRMVRDKGLVDLEQAWQSLRVRNPKAVLLLVGPEETGDSVPPDVMQRFRADPCVRIVGRTANSRKWLLAADIVTLPSYREGLPNVLLEAAAMSRPVVATRVTGCIDAVEDGITGLLVPVADAIALSASIELYLRSPQLRVDHGAAARERVLRLFLPEKLWHAQYMLYLKMAKLCMG